MKKKTIFIIIIGIITISAIIFFIFFNQNMAKTSKIGHNSTSQDIVDYILNIRSYETKIEVEVNSNKNTNKYILKQKYSNPEISIQEVIEPSNIAGVKIVKSGNTLKIENTQLNLTKITENYECIADNALDLSCFIENYKQNEQSYFREENNQIIMETTNSTDRPYTKYKTLYIDKNTAKPIKMEIKDNNKKTNIYILYNEVEINSLNKENVLAFKTISSMQEI